MIVFDFDTGASIHHVTGDGVEALRLISGGLDDGDLPEHLRSSVDELIDAGVVEASSSVSRRKALSLGAKGLVAGGAVWGAATVTTFALADPAAAATPCTNHPPTDPAAQKYTANATYITGRGVTSLQVRAWGGGGGGGGGKYDGTWSSGSGGGGGAYAYTASLTVSPCTPYTVVVGTGGGGGPKRTDGNPGNDSYFGSTSTVMAKGGGKGIGANGGNPAGGTGGQASASYGATTKTNGGNGGQGGANVGENTGGGGGGGASDGGAGGNGGNHNGTGGAGGAAGGAVTGGAGGGNSGAGNVPSGGGGGGYGFLPDSFSTAGGNGASGQVWIGY